MRQKSPPISRLISRPIRLEPFDPRRTNAPVAQRSISDHVQWWSYLYGFVLGKWPASLLTLRSDLVSAIAKTEWFDESLNRRAGRRCADTLFRTQHLSDAHPTLTIELDELALRID